MAIPTDRGYAIISVDATGKITVSVSATLPDQGGSEHIFAVHSGESKVAVHEDVALTKMGNLSWTTVPVQVFVDARGLVHVAQVSATGVMTKARASGTPAST